MLTFNKDRYIFPSHLLKNAVWYKNPFLNTKITEKDIEMIDKNNSLYWYIVHWDWIERVDITHYSKENIINEDDIKIIKYKVWDYVFIENISSLNINLKCVKIDGFQIINWNVSYLYDTSIVYENDIISKEIFKKIKKILRNCKIKK